MLDDLRDDQAGLEPAAGDGIGSVGLLDALDNLEELVEASPRVPLTGRVVVSEQELYRFLDEVREAIPREMREARWTVLERERILEDARREAERVVREARDQVSELAEETSVARKAEQQAEEIVERARKVARDIRLGALEYARELFDKTGAGLEKGLETLRRAKEEIEASK